MLQEGRVVQEDTREVGPVAPVDLRDGLVQNLHQPDLTHRLGGFPDLYTHSSRQDSHWDNLWDNQGRQEDSWVRDRWCHRIRSGSTGETIVRSDIETDHERHREATGKLTTWISSRKWES